MFIRTKKIKGKDYAYLISNKYSKRKKQSRQNSTKYLGKVINLGETNNQVKAKSIEQAILNTLKHFGFTNKKKTLNKSNITIDLVNKKVQQEEKNVCLKLNEGYICSYTLLNLLDFKSQRLTNSEGAHEFADAFISAGINIDNNSFISIFSKFYKSTE